MSDQEIKIEYVHTEKIYLSATRLYLLSSPRLLIRVAVFWVLIVAGAAMLAVLVEGFPFWVPVLLALTIATFVLYNILRQAPTKYFRDDPKFRDKYELTASDEGIAVKTQHIDSRLAWSLYTRVIEGNDVFLLKYGKDLPMMTMIPKSAFKDDRQEQAFRQLVKRHIIHYTAFGKIRSSRIIEREYQPSSLNPPDWR